MQIEKGKPRRLFPDEEQWQELGQDELFRIAEALSDPIRQWVFSTLSQGPLRQAELAKRASEKFGRKISNILMSYHLQKLEEAGLVRFEYDPIGKAKRVHRAVDLKVQARPLEERIHVSTLDEELREVLVSMKTRQMARRLEEVPKRRK